MPPPVEGHPGAERALGGGEGHDTLPPRQKPTTPDTGRRESSVGEVGERRVDVGQEAVEAQRAHVGHERSHVVVRDDRVAAAVEQVRRDRPVALGSEPAADVLDVAVDPERLLEHDHARPRRPVGRGVVEPIVSPADCTFTVCSIPFPLPGLSWPLVRDQLVNGAVTLTASPAAPSTSDGHAGLSHAGTVPATAVTTVGYDGGLDGQRG